MRKAAPRYEKMAGLMRKNFLFDAEAGIGGGVYTWETREAAETVYAEGGVWRETIRTVYGAEPTVQIFETPVLVDKRRRCRAHGCLRRCVADHAAMKVVQFARTGHPPDVVEIVDRPADPLRKDEVRLAVEAAAINPAHLLTLEGTHGVRPELPAVPGAEGLGTVVEVGNAVTGFAPGERVMLPPYAGTWRQELVVAARRILVKLPAEGDAVQLSMLMANPPTAYLMLKQFVDLGAGDWVIQNVANSAVGRYLIQLARLWGIKSANVVRRDDVADDLVQTGADVVLVDGDYLADRVADATGGADIRLAIDAVAGDATARLAACLVKGGTVVNYGLLSGEPCRLSPAEIIFREITLTGFWLTLWLREKSTPAERDAVYGELAGLIASGQLATKVDTTYPLSEIKAAVAHAMAAGRGRQDRADAAGRDLAHVLIERLRTPPRGRDESCPVCPPRSPARRRRASRGPGRATGRG